MIEWGNNNANGIPIQQPCGATYRIQHTSLVSVFFCRQPELVYYFCTATHTILHALITPLIYENETAFESNELENNRFRLIEMNMIIVIAARPRWNLFAVCVPRAILICEFYYY